MMSFQGNDNEKLSTVHREGWRGGVPNTQVPPSLQAPPRTDQVGGPTTLLSLPLPWGLGWTADPPPPQQPHCNPGAVPLPLGTQL